MIGIAAVLVAPLQFDLGCHLLLIHQLMMEGELEEATSQVGARLVRERERGRRKREGRMSGRPDERRIDRDCHTDSSQRY